MAAEAKKMVEKTESKKSWELLASEEDLKKSTLAGIMKGIADLEVAISEEEAVVKQAQTKVDNLRHEMMVLSKEFAKRTGVTQQAAGPMAVHREKVASDRKPRMKKTEVEAYFQAVSKAISGTMGNFKSSDIKAKVENEVPHDAFLVIWQRAVKEKLVKETGAKDGVSKIYVKAI